jgi:hypothetical protein
MRETIKPFLERGYVCVRTNGGHFQLKIHGHVVTTFSGTRVNFRDYKNLIAEVRRWERAQARQRGESDGTDAEATRG